MLISASGKPNFSNGQRGSILLEGLIAILIFSFGILGLIGLTAVSMKSTTAAKERIDASLVASQRIAELWRDPANLAGAANVAVAGLPGGTMTTVVNGNLVTVTVGWTMPGEQPSTHTVIAQINRGRTP